MLLCNPSLYVRAVYIAANVSGGHLNPCASALPLTLVLRSGIREYCCSLFVD